MIISYAINARDFTPVYSTGGTNIDSSKWYTVDGSIEVNQHQSAVSYVNAVGIGAVYSKLAICGYTFSKILSNTYDIWAYMKGYSKTGAYLRVNAGAWNNGGSGVTFSFKWIKLGTFNLKDNDKLEIIEEGTGGSVVIKDFYIVTSGSPEPIYIPTGTEGYRTSQVIKFFIKDENNCYSIKEEDYNESTGEYIPRLISTLDINNFENYGMSDLSLINSNNIDNFIDEKFNVTLLK